MKPDCWIPFYGKDFFSAVEGYDEIMVVCYLRALWHYWNHLHCSGLPDEDAYLQRICHCPDHVWARTKGVIFDDSHFFTKAGGMWHQKRAQEEFGRAMERYNALIDASKKGVNKRRELGQVVKPSGQPMDKPSVITNDNPRSNRAITYTQPHTHTNTPPTPSECTSDENRGTVDSVTEYINRLTERLNQVYKRGPMDRWTYAEQTALVEVCRREGCLAELDHILAYRRALNAANGKRYFPQSLASLLDHWTETLDKARVQCPVKKAAPIQKMPDDLKPFTPSLELAKKFRKEVKL